MIKNLYYQIQVALTLITLKMQIYTLFWGDPRGDKSLGERVVRTPLPKTCNTLAQQTNKIDTFGHRQAFALMLALATT